MTDIIDLTAERDKRDGPDPEFVSVDEYGRKLFTYMLDYDLGDEQYSTQLVAYSMEDAQKHVDAMRKSLCLAGQLYSVIPS